MKVLSPLRVKVPAPAFVSIAALSPSLIIPVIVLVPLLVIANVPCALIAAAVKTAVPIVVFPNASDPPTVPENVVLPVPATIS